MSAKMAFTTGDQQWEQRYKKFESLYNADLKKIISLTPPKSKAVSALTSSGKMLFKIEGEAFALLKKQQKEKAYALLQSREYTDQKTVYSKAVESLTHIAAKVPSTVKFRSFSKKIHLSTLFYSYPPTSIKFLSQP